MTKPLAPNMEILEFIQAPENQHLTSDAIARKFGVTHQLVSGYRRKLMLGSLDRLIAQARNQPRPRKTRTAVGVGGYPLFRQLGASTLVKLRFAATVGLFCRFAPPEAAIDDFLAGRTEPLEIFVSRATLFAWADARVILSSAMAILVESREAAAESDLTAWSWD